MGERAKVAAKTSEPEKGNPVSRIRRTDFSHSTGSPIDHVLLLQRTVGNQAVQCLLQSGAIQAKLKIGQLGDKYEQEADRIADVVTSKPGPQVQQQTAQKEKTPQSQKNVGQTSEAAPELESRTRTVKVAGQPLPESVRAFFEPRFAQDFSCVRIHSDPEAGEMARALNAKAFTIGRSVIFGPGQYSPETPGGRKLLAHELTHVVQQSEESSVSPMRVMNPSGPSEMEAEGAWKDPVQKNGLSITKEPEAVITRKAGDDVVTSPSKMRPPEPIPSILPGEATTEAEEKFPLGWYKRFAKDVQAVEIFTYWLEGHGDEMILEDEPWKRYMMNNKLLEEQIINQLKEDAMQRKTWLEKSGLDVLHGDVDVIRYHAEIENGYRTGYELLHGTNREVGDFEIEGNFAVKKAPQFSNVIDVGYELRFCWNDIIDPVKGHIVDEMAAMFFKFCSDYNPMKYVIRIKWNANAIVKIRNGMIWGSILSPTPLTPQAGGRG